MSRPAESTDPQQLTATPGETVDVVFASWSAPNAEGIKEFLGWYYASDCVIISGPAFLSISNISPGVFTLQLTFTGTGTVEADIYLWTATPKRIVITVG